jgi:Ca2+-binding RTX toxin-like protein
VIAGIALATGAVVLAQNISGSPNDDTLVGTDSADVITGGGGNDSIDGLGGDDQLYGEGGNDTITGGPGRDEINMTGGVEQPDPGDDVIHARDGELDEISCGAGNDTAYVDRAEDGIYDCETVITP